MLVPKRGKQAALHRAYRQQFEECGGGPPSLAPGTRSRTAFLLDHGYRPAEGEEVLRPLEEQLQVHYAFTHNPLSSKDQETGSVEFVRQQEKRRITPVPAASVASDMSASNYAEEMTKKYGNRYFVNEAVILPSSKHNKKLDKICYAAALLLPVTTRDRVSRLKSIDEGPVAMIDIFEGELHLHKDHVADARFRVMTLLDGLESVAADSKPLHTPTTKPSDSNIQLSEHFTREESNKVQQELQEEIGKYQTQIKDLSDQLKRQHETAMQEKYQLSNQHTTQVADLKGQLLQARLERKDALARAVDVAERKDSADKILQQCRSDLEQARDQVLSLVDEKNNQALELENVQRSFAIQTTEKKDILIELDMARQIIATREAEIARLKAAAPTTIPADLSILLHHEPARMIMKQQFENEEQAANEERQRTNQLMKRNALAKRQHTLKCTDAACRLTPGCVRRTAKAPAVRHIGPSVTRSGTIYIP